MLEELGTKPTCRGRQHVFAELKPVGQVTLGSRSHHMDERLLNVSAQLWVGLPVQQTEQSSLQTHLFYSDICRTDILMT